MVHDVSFVSRVYVIPNRAERTADVFSQNRQTNIVVNVNADLWVSLDWIMLLSDHSAFPLWVGFNDIIRFALEVFMFMPSNRPLHTPIGYDILPKKYINRQISLFGDNSCLILCTYFTSTSLLMYLILYYLIVYFSKILEVVRR